ncbi:hypothetical protein NE659_28050, partial [Flavonifractor plautii]|nr:hypothetical protein [Flavonifractor plautii]
MRRIDTAALPGGVGVKELQGLALVHRLVVEEYQWATQDCMSLDGVPYIGPYSSSTSNLYVATGF